MNHFLTAAAFVAGLAVAWSDAAGAGDVRPAVSLTSFGAAQVISSYRMSAAGMTLPASSADAFTGNVFVLPVAYGVESVPSGVAASTALSINIALDAGYNLDLTQRFENYDGLASPLLNDSGFLGLANGGHYGGLTFAPLPSLRLRVGAQLRNDRLDHFAFDPTQGMNGFSLIERPGEQRSLLAGASWDFSDWAGLTMSGIVSQQSGVPLGLQAGLAPAGKATTSAMDVSAHLNFGGGWVTTATYNAGLTQLDQKSSLSTALDTRSYSVAIAKHGLFGDDALGFSVSRPSPALVDNGFELMAAQDDIPPAFLANSRLANQKPETDLQLGYVTSFLDGALALQANAAYQMNYQGQTGATSLAVLSRAKIKF